MTRKIFFARDWNGVGKNYFEIYTTVCLGYTFAVGQGIERDPNFSIFSVTNDGKYDQYKILDEYITASDTVEQVQKGVVALLQREMKREIKRCLMARIKSGMLTVEQVEKWKEHLPECEGC